MKYKIPHRQIRNIMKTLTKYDISEKAISLVEKYIIQEVEKISIAVADLMDFKGVKTLKKEILERIIIEDFGESEDILQRAPIKRLIKENKGIYRVPDNVVEIFKALICSFIRNITNEAIKFVKHAGLRTIKDRHIEYAHPYIDSLLRAH